MENKLEPCKGGTKNVHTSVAPVGLKVFFTLKPRAYALGYISAGPSGLLMCGLLNNYID